MTARDALRTEIVAFKLLNPKAQITLDILIQCFLDMGWRPPADCDTPRQGT